MGGSGNKAILILLLAHLGVQITRAQSLNALSVFYLRLPPSISFNFELYGCMLALEEKFLQLK